MYSQLLVEGEPPRATGARFLKTGAALSAGTGFVVGLIVAISLHNTSVAESNTLVALFGKDGGRIRSGVKVVGGSGFEVELVNHYALKHPDQSFYDLGAKHTQEVEHRYGPRGSERNRLTVAHGLGVKREHYALKQPRDPFYLLGSRQIEQSKAFVATDSERHWQVAAQGAKDHYALKHPDQSFYDLGVKHEQEVANRYGPRGSERNRLTVAHGLGVKREHYALKQPDDPFLLLGSRQVEQSNAFAANDAERSWQKAFEGSKDHYALKHPDQPFYDLGVKHEQEVANRYGKAKENERNRLQEAYGMQAKRDHYAPKNPSDPFYDLGDKHVEDIKKSDFNEAYGLRTKQTEESRNYAAKP